MAQSKMKLEDIKAEATAKGVDKDWLFKTTLERYEMQLKILAGLKEVIEAEGTLVTKEYVKGRANVYTHPAITEYNKTCTATNTTATTLINIVRALPEKTNEATLAERMAQLTDD